MAIQRSCDRGVAVVGGTEELPDAVRAGLGKQPRTGCSDPTATTITTPRPVGVCVLRSIGVAGSQFPALADMWVLLVKGQTGIRDREVASGVVAGC